LLSMALVREDGESIYLIYVEHNAQDPWVRENVLPVMRSTPYGVTFINCTHMSGALRIAEFLRGDLFPHINTDWPDDIRHFCQAIIVGPGQMIAIPHISFDVHRVDAYPTDLPGAI